MNFFSCRDVLPDIWEWVLWKSHATEDKHFTAYRTLFGSWKFKSGIKVPIQGQNVWAYKPREKK